MSKKITAYKGFDENMKCRGYQYKVGEKYTHEGAVSVCYSGFHACTNPFDVWGYYDVSGPRFAVVTLSGEKDERDSGNSKIASEKITIDAELKLPEFIKAAVEWVIDKTKGEAESGDSAQIGSSGYSAKIGSSGYSAQIGSSGYSAKIGSSGGSAKIGSSGYSAQIGSSGCSAKIGSSGYSARVVSDGKNAVIACAGYNATFKAKNGAWVSIAEFKNGICIGFVSGQVGTKNIKPNVLYKAENGKFKEVT